jgi:hypothetical protein
LHTSLGSKKNWHISDPRQWSRDDVRSWLLGTLQQFSIRVKLAKFQIPGSKKPGKLSDPGSKKTGTLSDPRQWSRDDVRSWLLWTLQQFSIPVKLANFQIP